MLEINAPRADELTVKTLIALGVLYINESGIHTNEPGIYPKPKENLNE